MKRFLTDNKIYFETFTAVALSVMAILVSCKSNEIAQSDMELNKLAHLPVISATFDTSRDVHGRISHTLNIIKSGGPMYEFAAIPFSYIKLYEMIILEPEKSDALSSSRSVRVPLTGYFPYISYSSGAEDGPIMQYHISGPEKFHEVFHSFSDKKSDENSRISSDIEKYLVVSYTDKFREKHTQYYSFDYAGRSIPMDDSAGRELFLKYSKESKSSQHVIEYSSPSITRFENVWDEKIELNSVN